MFTIQPATARQQHEEALELFNEYIEANCLALEQHYGIDWDAAATREADRANLRLFLASYGRLWLAHQADVPVGVLAVKFHEDGAAELKRMYVRPDSRRHGIGRALLERAIEDAKLLRLDSAEFMHEAHELYRSVGFHITPPYSGSEIPLDLQRHWVFMELPLGEARASQLDAG
ncbi:GNAT family N-acetyltransferase [Deinococcus yavapaiensis]|uniref:Acetyltransferase (GNAT) family protein n=1 Tax=Deinococcus yavapaiensis KR-236 TaxID=694435 RepID=A0A318S0X0_9DEIO|nr:GNAT family N-acetyltransferase [Deinococcus yavapaiensis]PYE49416.1 acetyltransferase (GNAT) family protein [Deinococcus yavapaiensis KR-236]